MTEDNVASILLKQQKLGLADQTLESVRCAGDLLVAPSLTHRKRRSARGFVSTIAISFECLRGNLTDLQKETEVVESYMEESSY